jgi:hypothetical protein
MGAATGLRQRSDHGSRFAAFSKLVTNGRGGGGVSVTLGRDTRLSIDAYSSGGSVSCELPVRPLGKQTRTTLRGDLNGGGSVLKLRSSGGGIHIDANGG